MKKQDYNKFANGLGTVWEVFNPGKTISDVLVGAYFKTLSDYDIGKVEKAFHAVLISSRFFPKPVELIEAMSGGKIEDVAMVQSSLVLETVRQIGGYETVKFDNTVTNAVIKQAFGGWIQLCEGLLLDQEKWFIKDFVKAYSAYSRQNVSDNTALPGRTEIQNTEFGNKHKKVKLIGQHQNNRIRLVNTGRNAA